MVLNVKLDEKMDVKSGIMVLNKTMQELNKQVAMKIDRLPNKEDSNQLNQLYKLVRQKKIQHPRIQLKLEMLIHEEWLNDDKWKQTIKMMRDEEIDLNQIFILPYGNILSNCQNLDHLIDKSMGQEYHKMLSTSLNRVEYVIHSGNVGKY